MPFTILGNQQSDVLPGAQITLANLFETYPGSGEGAPASGVTIGITAATTATGGSGTPVTTGSTGIQASSDSLYQYVWAVEPDAVPGDYVVTWTGVVDGNTLTYTQAVTVAAPASVTPAPGVYGTVQQYRAVTGDQITPDFLVTANLQRASEDIDNALIGAVYATNANGLPTDPMLLDVLVRATSRQCEYLLAENDPTGVKKQFTSVNAGGVNSSRAPGSLMPAMPLLAPRAAQILHVSGVLQSAALINW